jgi:hypothetical protein
LLHGLKSLFQELFPVDAGRQMHGEAEDLRLIITASGIFIGK